MASFIFFVVALAQIEKQKEERNTKKSIMKVYSNQKTIMTQSNRVFPKS